MDAFPAHPHPQPHSHVHPRSMNPDSMHLNMPMHPDLPEPDHEASIGMGMGNGLGMTGDDSYDDGEYINHDGGLEDSAEMGQQEVELDEGEGEDGSKAETGQGNGEMSRKGSSQEASYPNGNGNGDQQEDDAMMGIPSRPPSGTGPRPNNTSQPNEHAGPTPLSPQPIHVTKQEPPTPAKPLVDPASFTLPPVPILHMPTTRRSVKQESISLSGAGSGSGAQPQAERKPIPGLGVNQVAEPVQRDAGTGTNGFGTSDPAGAGSRNQRGSSAEAGPSRLDGKRKASGKKRTREAKPETDNDADDFLNPVDENEEMPSIPAGSIFKNAFGPDDVDEMDDDDDDDDSPNERRSKKSKNADDKSSGFVVDGDGDQARRKIRIEYIEDRSRRHITFSKRKAGIMKKAYELSTLTGTQLLLLVVSETGLVYTFSTDKLSPMVQKADGVKMIQACLNTPEVNAEDEEEDKEEPKPKRKGKDKLAIRPLKLNDSAKANLANSASKAAAQNPEAGPVTTPSPPPAPVEEPVAPPTPSLPSSATARPKKRLPSGKSKKALAAAKKATETEENGTVPNVPELPPFNMPQQQPDQHLQQPLSGTSSHHSIGPHPGMLSMMSPIQANYPNHMPPHMPPDYHPQQHPYYAGHPGPPTHYAYAPPYAMPNTMPPNAMSQNGHYGQHPMQMPHYESLQEHGGFAHHHAPESHMNPQQMGLTGQ